MGNSAAEMTPGFVRVRSRDGKRSATCREFEDGRCYVFFGVTREGPLAPQEALKRAEEVVNG